MGGNLSCTSGMKCASGKKSERKKKNLGEQLEEKRQLVDELRTKSSELIPRLSQHDRELLDQSIRSVERRCSELQASVEKHCRSYGVLGKDLGDVRQEASQYLQWLDSQSSVLASETGLGFANSNTEFRLKAAKELKRELDEKQVVLQIVRQKADAVLQDLPGPERASVEHLVAQAQARHEQVFEQVSNECVRLETAQVQHVEFQQQVDKEKEWLNTHAKMADKLDAVRLLASDVEKQADESKILAVKVQNRISRLDQLEASGQMLKEQCIDDSSTEIGEILAELREQHGGLIARLKQQEDHLRSCSAVCHVYETDYQKIEHWCNETDIRCMGDLPLDCGTEVLEVQCRQYEELASTAHGFESLLTETLERGENFKRHLHDADLPILENQMASLQNRFSSTLEVIRERTDSLERTMRSRLALQTSVESSTRWLDDMQAQIQAASVAPGYSVQEAEQALHRFKDLEKMIADYQEVMTELSSYVEPLRAEGQVSQAEAILHLTSQYEFLMDTLVSSHKRSQAALAIRQQHQKQLSELYTSLEDTQKEMARVLASDLSIPKRLQIYKELEHRLISLQPQIRVSEDHAQQIAADCLQADRAGVLSQVETVKEQLSDLCLALSARSEHCQQLQLEQEGFEAAMNETISWLEDKEDILASLRPLHLDSDKVDPVIEKHKIMSREAEKRISDIKTKAAGELTRYQELEEPVPNVMCEKLQQIEALEQSIQQAIQKKEQYLLGAKTERQQLETMMHQVGDWLRGAEELLDSGYDGLDYSLIDQTLTEFSDYFSEASLCQDEMDQVSELSDKLLTSLDSNDTQTLQQSRSSVSKRFSRILASSQQKVEHLESKSAQWHDFQEKMQVMSTVLDELETQWQEVDVSVLTSAQDIETHLQPLKTFNAKLEGERPSIGALNETARSLIRTANADSAGMINRVISSLNQRWDALVSHAENKLSSFEELQGQWVEFSASLHGAADVLHSVQDTLNMATALTDSNADLVEKVDLLRVSKDDLDTIGPQMERLRASSTDLQKALPSAEAKVALEERFIVLQENYTRLKSCVQENLSRVQEELDDRENFQKEVSQLRSWLTDTESDLQRMDPEAEDTGCNLEKIKLYQHELKVRMEQVQREQATQQTKYEAEGRELPQEMSQQLQEVLALEKAVSVALRQKEEELVHIHQDREEYQASLATVTSWLQQASQQVQECIISIPQARTRHQELLSQFDEFKHSLDKLRTKGSDIIQHTTDQGEKHSVQKTIAVINRQWLSLQAQTADRTHELTEAADLAHAVDDVASSVQTWLVQAETALSSHLDWSNSDSVREQLKCHRHLAKELEQNEDRVIALNAMVKQLGQVCDTSTSMAAITALRQRVQQVSSNSATCLGLLEDANKKFEDYEREISDLTRWMEETRTHLSKRDTTHDLKEQLALHERLLEDIRNNKARTEVVLQQHTPLGDLRGQAPLSQGDRLLREIGQLEEAAQEQCGQLQVAVTEQEEYESELRHLHAAISEAQQQLLASPVQASSVEALKQQIAEHNNLASQIKIYQARVSEINEKSRQLSLRVAQASTVVDRKRYLPELVYRNWASSASSDAGIDVQSVPVSSASHTMDSTSFDSVLDGINSVSQSLQPSPSSTTMTDRSSPIQSLKHLAFGGIAPHDTASVAFETAHFKPISDRTQQKSSAFQWTGSPGKSGMEVKSSAGDGLAWQGLSGSVEPYTIKSASDSDIPGLSLDKKSYLQNRGDGRGYQSSQVTAPQLLKVDIPRSLSKHDDPAKTSTPRREGRAWSTSVSTPGTGRRSLSHSPDKGRKSYEPPRMRSLSPALQSTAVRGRESGSLLVAAGGGAVCWQGARALEGIMQSAVPRKRSASFGQRTEPLGLPLGDSSAVTQLNVSWNSLQKQVAAKERELQVALQKQEKYQQAVQELNARMERVQIRLAQTPASSAADVNTQMKEYREALSELEGLKEDIARVQERGHQIMETSDAESQKAMGATVTMLSDRLSNLQTVADHRGKQLQDAVKHRNKHDIALSAYKKRVSDLEKWLTEMKIAHASSGLPTDEPSALQQQLQDNRDLQDEINSRLQQISDLAVQCDSLCDLEQPAQADVLRNSLASLQSSLGNFKFAAIEKETALRSAIREAEKRRREMEDYEKNVQKLQQWMMDTKQMTLASEQSPPVTFPDHQQLRQELASDLSQHRQLVRQLSISTPSQKAFEKLQSSASEERKPAPLSVTEEELHVRWEKLQRELAQKTGELESVLQRRKSGDGITPVCPSIADTPVQLDEVQALMLQLTQCWQVLQVQVADKQQRLDTVLSFQQQMQSAFTAISTWLDLAEQMVLSSSTEDQPEHEQIRRNEALQRELRSLHSEISTLSNQAQSLLGTSVQSHGLIQQSLTSLTQRVGMLESQAASHSTQLHQSQLQWQQYHEDVRLLRSHMQELQTSAIMPTAGSAATLDSLVSDVHKIESQLKKCENRLSELKARERELSVGRPRGAVLSELSTLHNSFMELQRKVAERKASLLQSVSVQEQYEKMLKDYAYFLETAEGKLRTESISARDLPHLKQQLSAHKEFFSDLEVHKAMLDSLAAQCDVTTQEGHSMQHTRLSNLMHVLADQASLHGQRLDRAVRQWVELDSKLEHLWHFLDQVQEGIPKPVESGDSLATIQEKLVKFKRLQGQLGDEKPAVFQAVDKGKQILHSVACPALETTLTELADKWVKLNTQLVQELKKTETIGEQLQIFEAEAMVLKTWMSTAKMKLESLKYLTEEDMQNIGNIRTKVEHVLEFRKEVQNQLPLKNKVLSVGRQLMANSSYDTRGLDARLEGIEEEWSQLEQAIDTAAQSLHQAQMELMPSRQALHELQLWMEEMEKALAADANTTIRTNADIDVMLKKYKGHKVDLASKQLTVDFVNQAVLQPGPQEKDVPHEKLEFAEKLAEVNHHWQEVSSAINERLRSLEGLAGLWSDYERAVGQLHMWFRQQEDKLKRYRLIGHEVGVKQTLKDCKAMQEQLQARKEDMERVKRLGQSLINQSKESAGCQRSVRDSLSSVWQQWEQLQQQTMQLESLLTDMLGQWARYHTDLHSLSQVLAQIEYTLNRYSLVGADIKALGNQVDKLKNLEAELKQHSGHLDSFTTLATQLCQVCEPPVQAEVQGTVLDLKARCSRLSADLSTRRAEFELCLVKWREYEQQCRHVCEWLEQKEQEANQLLTMREDIASRQDCLKKSEALEQELDGVQTQLSSLYRLSDELTKNMGTSTIVLLTSQQSGLEQRLLALRQLLSQHIQALCEDLSQGKLFRKAFSTVVAFLEHAQQVLSSEDPSKSAEHSALQKRLDQLKQLLAQFQTKAGKLDEVNDLGYRLALDASDASQLIELNHTWHRLLADCQDRCKALQGHLLSQQDFTAKCETWMTFLASVEHDLSSEIAGNLRDLLEQQKKCQKFESDMYSNQQVLHAIISDGQKMMRAGEVEDPQEFEQKLRLLSEQWQTVIRRAKQHKNIINTTIQNWHMFNSLAEQLRKWLAEKESTLKTFQFDMVSLQQVRSLLDKVRTAQKEFSLQEESFRKVHDLGGMLLHQTDLSASQDIKQCTAQLQNDWLQIYSRLEEHSQRLEAVQRDWLECETDIEDILAWLKNIRSMLATDIPHAYDDLQSDLTKCKDISVSFANSEDKRQALLAREKNLSRFLQAEDMNVLHQRIRLLNKQWDELVSQAGLREQRLLDSTFHWSSLGQQIRALIQWIDQMEMKITSSREIHVEDLLSKLENEYQEAIREKGLEKEELLSKGRNLMKNSSEIRASDIEQRLQNLADKWQHLLGIVDFRRKKLHETVLAVRQLDSNMHSLSQWLASMEQELHAPVVFQDCDLHDIQRQLEQTQNFQQEVEHHSAGISSVLNLCEVLLHDSDACPTQKEFDALHHAMKNLDRRWKDICSLCPERRAWIEETWHMWEDFQTDCKRFSLWLGEMELEAGDPEIVAPGGSMSKEEIRRYEALQTKVLDHLDNLESINKQYRRLVKEGRTDTSGVLKAAMQEVNDRWDSLQLRVRAIMQGMRQSASVREDFMTTHASLFKWLTEVDMQLTNIEHLSQLDVHTKLKELKRIEQEVDDRRHRMDYLNQAAALLIQQGTGEEAQKIQEDLNEFKIFSRNVLEHIATCYLKLQHIASAQEQPLRSSEFTPEVVVGSKDTFIWDSQQVEEYLKSSPPTSPPHKRRAGVETVRVPKASVPPIRRSYSPSRRSASPSHQQRQSPSHRGQDVTDSGERWQAARRERNAKIDVLMEQLIDALKDASAQLDTAEQQLQNYSPSLTDSAVSLNQLQSLVACEGLIDTIQRLDRLLKIETGTNIPSADFHISEVLERWERLQSFASQGDLRLSQQQHELAKFHADVDGLLTWLEEAEALQASHSHIPLDILDLSNVIRQHKDFMVQLESKKAHMLSIRLLSKNYVNAQTSEGRQLLSRLQELDQRWEALTAAAARTQQALQDALLQCQEFHHTVHDYLVWLESVEDRLRCCEPVSLSADHSALWGKHRILKDLHRELADNQAKVLTLRETAEQLLVIGESPELAAARDKTRIIANRLRSLLHLTTSYIESLETKLGVKSSSVDSREARQLTLAYPTVRSRNRSPFAVLRRLLFGVPPISVPASDSENVNLTTKSDPVTGLYQAPCIGRRSLLYRVLRAALPLQVLLFLLVGVACLLPVCEGDDYGCLLSNNMRTSLTPMLRYTGGAPPT